MPPLRWQHDIDRHRPDAVPPAFIIAHALFPVPPVSSRAEIPDGCVYLAFHGRMAHRKPVAVGALSLTVTVTLAVGSATGRLCPAIAPHAKRHAVGAPPTV